MKRFFVFVLLVAFCCGCSHSGNQTAEEVNATEDNTTTDSTQVLTHSYRVDVIEALYMLGCNDRLEMGLPDDYIDSSWDFYFLVDSLANTSGYFPQIEANIAKDPHHEALQDSIDHWLFLSKMLRFPIRYDLVYPENDVIDQLPQTHHLLEKYIDRDIQCIESLSERQWGYYYIDIINYIFSLPYEEQMDFIIDYYTKVKNIPKTERPQ